MHRRRDLLLAAGAGLLAGCGSPVGVPNTSGDPGDGRPTSGMTERTTGTAPESTGSVGYTHLRPGGNRVVAGAGGLPDASPTDLSVEGTPAWIAGVARGAGAALAVVNSDGDVWGFEVGNGTATGASITPESLPRGTPPALVDGEGGLRLLVPPGGASTLTHPIPVGDGHVAVWADGSVRKTRGGETVARRAVDALPDARPLRDGRGGIVLLAGATGRYGHGVLGDGTEAGEVVRLDSKGLAVETRIAVPGGAVVEGIAPILADVTGSGSGAGRGKDVVVTESDAERGARIALYSLEGERLAAGPPVGTGFQWRHQIAVAPFPPDGRPEIAVVRTPHIGGEVEFYRYREGGTSGEGRGGDLEIAATLSGYSTHAIGSRVLDGGAAGDFDGDGRVELLVPTDDRRTLAGIRRTGRGANEAWRLPLGGALSTNVLAVRTGTGILAAAGREDGTVRVWR